MSPVPPSRQHTRWRLPAALLAAAGISCAGVVAPPAAGAAVFADDPAPPALSARGYADLPPVAQEQADEVLAAAPEPLFPGSPPRWSTGGYRVTRPAVGAQRGTPDNYAVRVWQELLTEQGVRTDVDGVYGRLTAGSVTTFQARRGLAQTGAIDYRTAQALLAPTIRREADRAGMSADLLCGHLDLESNLDPRAVNPNGRDIGIGQINIGRWNPGVTVDQAFDEDYAIRYMARRDVGAYARYRNWRIAVYDYNWPVDAQQWARTGVPSARGKAYSDRVFRGCSGPEFPGDP